MTPWCGLLALCVGGCFAQVGESVDPAAAGLPDGYSIVGDSLIYEGDIVVGPVQEHVGPDGELLVFKGAGQFDVSSDYREVGVNGGWPGGVIPYKLEAGLPGALRGHIEAAKLELLAKTGILLYEAVEVRPPNYIVFREIASDGKVCGNSSVGMQASGPQDVNLIADAQYTCVLHELGHAIGLMHEHQRSDSPLTVTGNVAGLTQSQRASWLPASYGHRGITRYDDYSVMHYSSGGAEAAGIQFVNDEGDEVSIPVNGLSYSDIQAIQVMYGDQFEPTLSVPHVGDDGGNFPAYYRGVFFRGSNGKVAHVYWTGKRWAELELDALPSVAAAAATEADNGDIYVYGQALRLHRQRLNLEYDWGAREYLHVPDGVEDRGLLQEPSSCGPFCSAVGSPFAIGGDVFVRGWGGQMLNWNITGWSSLGGISKDPVVAVRTGAQTHLLTVGWDFNLHHKRRPSASAAWQPTAETWDALPGNGYVRGRPSAVACDDETVEVVVKGLDGGAYYQTRDGGSWQPSWQTLGGGIVGNPKAVCWGPYLLLFARGLEGDLHYNIGYGSPGARVFSGWYNFGSPPEGFIGTPAVAVQGMDIEIYLRGMDNTIWRRGAVGGRWSGYHQISDLQASW